jgi:hypothetical protein
MSVYPERSSPIIVPRGDYHRRHFSSATFDSMSLRPNASLVCHFSPDPLLTIFCSMFSCGNVLIQLVIHYLSYSQLWAGHSSKPSTIYLIDIWKLSMFLWYSPNVVENENDRLSELLTRREFEELGTSNTPTNGSWSYCLGCLSMPTGEVRLTL